MRSLAQRSSRLGVPALGTLLALVNSGCSLTGIADFEPWQCKSDADCREAFNEGNGYYAECAAFTCEERGNRRECVRVGREICDGLDNDCDRLVDETVDGEPTLELVRRRVTSLSAAPSVVTHS
jgi:hypothetical protein